MRWPWDRARRTPPTPPTDDELAEQVDEGLLIVMTGLRLSTRNRIVLDAMRERADYDEDAVVAGVRADAEAIAAEQRAIVARLQRIRARAAGRHGAALHSADFRRGDVAPLERRERIAALLVERLEATVADEPTVRELVRAARRAAMEDMFGSVLHGLRGSPSLVDDAHDDRLAELHEQLRALAADLDDPSV